MRGTKYKLSSLEVMKFEILFSVDKLQCADLESDSKKFPIKKDYNSSSAATLQETVLVQYKPFYIEWVNSHRKEQIFLPCSVLARVHTIVILYIAFSKFANSCNTILVEGLYLCLQKNFAAW